MCSISGIISVARSAFESVDSTSQLRDAVGRMNAALRHRGPDDQGIETCEFRIGNRSAKLVLGNTRLAIIDTSVAGHQPMHDPDTGNWITYNGETYNFRELRREIGDEFGPWRSNTDTEVVLRAYRKWGTEAFSRLRGMFAFAIWDSRKEELVLARDQFGIKPLYYFLDSDADSTRSLIFASEVRALLASELVPRKLSVPAVSSFLEYGSVQAPLSIVQSVHSLMPGQCLSVRKDSASAFNVQLSEFPRLNREPRPASRAEAKSELRSLLENSVEQHLVSDVPIGVFLSGGMDSSAIVGLMSRVSPERPKTFSVVFKEQRFNEAHYSHLIAERFRTDHTEIILSEESLLSTLPQAIAALDQPTMDGINTYVVSKAVKNAGVKVALSGLGGDELFAGYPSFRRALKFASTSRVTRRALKAVAQVGHLASDGSSRRSKLWQLGTSEGSPTDIYRISRQLFSPDSVRAIGHTPVYNPPEPAIAADDLDTINAVSKLELGGYMANTLLRDTDFMSMAHSLEVRVPFVDREVADYVLSLPGKWKLNGQTKSVPKPLLADALDDLLPQEFLKRPKMGFTLPFVKWMTSELRTEVSAVLGNKSGLAQAGINHAPVQTVWQRFLQRPEAVGWSRPWSLYVLTKWCEANNVKVA